MLGCFQNYSILFYTVWLIDTTRTSECNWQNILASINKIFLASWQFVLKATKINHIGWWPELERDSVRSNMHCHWFAWHCHINWFQVKWASFSNWENKNIANVSVFIWIGIKKNKFVPQWHRHFWLAKSVRVCVLREIQFDYLCVCFSWR